VTMMDSPAGSVGLFSYGTLQEEAVRISIFGRVLSGSPDSLSGYALRKVKVADPAVVAISGEAWHPIVKRTGQPSDVVAGTVFEITPDELLEGGRLRGGRLPARRRDLGDGHLGVDLCAGRLTATVAKPVLDRPHV